MPTPPESRHQYLTNNHRIERFVFADATARAAGSGQVDGLGNAYTLLSEDVGQIAFQQSDSTYWRLTGVGPPAWLQLTGPGVLGTHVTEEVPAGAVDGTNASFTLAHAPLAGTLKIFLDGTRQRSGTHFSVSGTALTMTTAPEVGMALIAEYDY